MPLKGSRYQNVALFSAENNQQRVFSGSRSRTIGPATAVLEYIVKQDDRLDLLALYFYVDSRKWWRILDANPDMVFAADLTIEENIGDTILIPRASEAGTGP